jgi:tryptophan synthase alpha chain
MKRIEKKFRSLETAQDKALVVYITAGDPSLKKTEEMILALDKAGADILEIGVPFSDPTADGPVIQAASQRALKNGTTLEAILEMIFRVRKTSEIPIVLFGYYNPIFIYGNERFASKARDAGVDGILVVDLPHEEAGELRRCTDPKRIDFISLIAPTTDDKRVERIAKNASGFLYYISITGVTGTTKPRIEDVRRDVERIRTASNLPITVGFGITTPEQAREIAPFADGVVIGSAFVSLIEKYGKQDDLIRQVTSFAGRIKAAIKENRG